MHVPRRTILLIVTVIVAERAVFGAPRAALEPQRLVVTAPSYRASFHRSKCELQIELRDGEGHWRPITKGNTRPEFAVVDTRGVHSSFEAPARLCHSRVRDTVVVGLSTVLPSTPPTVVRVHFLCTDDGLLVRFAADRFPDDTAACWPLPRLALDETLRQSRFYHAHKDLYLDAELLGFEPLETSEPGLSLALWKRTSPPSLILHVINRQAEQGRLKRRSSVTVKLPTGSMPKAVSVVSPDWEGEKRGEAHSGGGKLTVVVPELEAYSVAILPYDQLPAVTLSGRRIVPSWQWARPARNEFTVRKGGLIPEQCALPGLLQGKLHRHLRNPPTFVVNMARGGSLAVHVRGVAMLGARLQWQVDGRVVKVVDLPDRDGKNDAMAREYDQTFEFAIPSGRHRVTLDNIGGDWACIGWYAFKGETLDP